MVVVGVQIQNIEIIGRRLSIFYLCIRKLVGAPSKHSPVGCSIQQLDAVDPGTICICRRRLTVIVVCDGIQVEKVVDVG